MHEYCHRCGADLPAGDESTLFCARCGSPQLILSEYSAPLSASTPTTGALPPPIPNPIDWETAIRCALIVAGIAAVLSLIASRVQLVSPISSIWIISASLTTLALYQHRRPLASMNARIGARIGVLVGIVLAASLASVGAVGALIARLWLHSMSEFDVEFAKGMAAQIDLAAANGPIPPGTLAFLHSAEFRSTMMLLGFLLLLVFVLVISVFGGALAGMLRSRRQPAA